jgi:hypothetical protein
MTPRPTSSAATRFTRWLSAATATLVLALATASAHGADASGARAIPPEAAAALNAAAAAKDPAAALAALDAYHGPPQALIECARAQADDQLADAAGPAGQPQRQAATAAYHAALALDPGLRQAHLGLAQDAARADDWATARDEIAAGLDIDRATAPELLFYAQAAAATGDWTLATVLSERGILRFPGEKAFRQQRLDALVRAGEILPARAAALALLDGSSTGAGDAALWRVVAWCDRQLGDAAGERAALEAVCLAPGHAAADVLRLARAQWDGGQARAVLVTLNATSAAPADPATVALAVSAARACHDLTAAQSWLARIAPAARDRRLRLLAAELAVQSGDDATAAHAAADLIALGENDPTVLVWAGAIAERGGDGAHAEAWYRQAFAGADGPNGNAATDPAHAPAEAPGVVTGGIRLAALLLKQGRRDEARDVLAVILARHGDDESAHRLMELASQAK